MDNPNILEKDIQNDITTLETSRTIDYSQTFWLIPSKTFIFAERLKT